MKSDLFRIDALAYGGDGVGRSSDGMVCFIPGALPGEFVEAEITVEKKRFRRGRLLKIVEASAERIDPECRYFAAGECPGCTYIHCNYACEIEWKQRQLRDFLVRRALADESVLLPPFASPHRFGMRNKLVMHIDNGVRGYVGKDNETVLPVTECLLAKPELNCFIQSDDPVGTRVIYRFTAGDGALNVTGRNGGFLTETLPHYGDFTVAPQGFFQTNTAVAAELIRRVIAVAQTCQVPRLVELYCGVGIFSIAAAEALPQLRSVGVELDVRAVEAAKRNAGMHHVAERCEFYAGDAGKLLHLAGKLDDAVLLLDPPRSGLSKEAVAAVLRTAPAQIIYISCAADTLVRDLESLRRGGWEVKSAGLLDMFPGTAHFEVMTVLQRSCQ